MKNKLRVVWICSVSNPQIRERIKFRKLSFLNFVRTLVGRSIGDSAQWNTNAINEFEKFNDIDIDIDIERVHYEKEAFVLNKPYSCACYYGYLLFKL